MLTDLWLTLGLAVFHHHPLILLPQIPVKQHKLVDHDLGFDEQLQDTLYQKSDRQALIQSIDNSLAYLQTNAAAIAYQQYVIPSITRDRVIRSLIRFRELLLSTSSAKELQAIVIKEFDWYRSIGQDNQGTVMFTAYYQPIVQASRVRTAVYRYPLYQRPSNFQNWSKPHPTRAQLEGTDGTGSSRMRGLEIAWLRDRLEGFLIQIQGSAKLEMTDGTTETIGYAGATDYPYTSIGRELAQDGKLPLSGQTIPVLTKFFERNPDLLHRYINRNRRMIFFRFTGGAPHSGSLQIPLTPGRSIATDKNLMPPGALVLLRTRLPVYNQQGQLEQRVVSRFALDQDTGSAIRGPGRVDYYMGSGDAAEERAGITGSRGELYYLILKN